LFVINGPDILTKYYGETEAKVKRKKKKKKAEEI
jgi:hypothetical protein